LETASNELTVVGNPRNDGTGPGHVNGNGNGTGNDNDNNNGNGNGNGTGNREGGQQVSHLSSRSESSRKGPAGAV
jgi:hypothetical protein